MSVCRAWAALEATRQIKREFPHMGIVALTMYEEQQYIFDLVRAGATGYLLKDSESSQIVAAIRAIYRGGIAHSPVGRQQDPR
ncbi:MAG: response regulator transcription factor [Nitrospira sp.]|nr:response regulator transcription factor [Nitrospira sp.]